MSSDIIIRDYEKGDEEQIIELLDLVFNDWPKFDLNCSKLDHWIWKYFKNPLQKNLLTVAIKDNQIIGNRGGVFRRYKIGTQIYTGLEGYDDSIHPDFQGKGIYSRMGEHRINHPDYKDRKIGISATENPLLMERSLRIGDYHFPKKINRYVRIEDIEKEVNLGSLEGIKNYTGFHSLKSFNKISNIIRRPHNNNEISILKIDRFSDDINTFIDKMHSSHDFIYERSSDILNWRYCDVGSGMYHVFLAKHREQCVGYIICRVVSKKLETPRGFIVDFLVDKEFSDASYLLLYEVVRFFDERSINMVVGWVTEGHWFESVFSFFGFLNTRRKVGIFVHRPNVGSDLEIMLKAPSDRLHFQMGDTDWI